MYQVKRAFKSEFIPVRGLQYHVQVWGEPAPDKIPLVMVHGWMDVGASFQFVVDALKEERAIVALDWRGFGLSDASGSDAYWFADYLGDLDALLAERRKGARITGGMLSIEGLQDIEGNLPPGEAPAAPPGTPEYFEQQLAKEREARALAAHVRHRERAAASGVWSLERARGWWRGGVWLRCRPLPSSTYRGRPRRTHEPKRGIHARD